MLPPTTNTFASATTSYLVIFLRATKMVDEKKLGERVSYPHSIGHFLNVAARNGPILTTAIPVSNKDSIGSRAPE